MRHPTNEREPFAFEKLLRTIFPVVAHQLWLVIEKFQLAWRAHHVEVDDAFDLALMRGR